MAEGASDADRGDRLAVGGDDRFHADHGVGPQKLERRVDFLEADMPALDRFNEDAGQAGDVDLEPELQRLVRRDARPHAAMSGAGDGFMKPQLAAPERLAAERVVAEYLAAFPEHSLGVLADVARERIEIALFGGHGRVCVDVLGNVEATGDEKRAQGG